MALRARDFQRPLTSVLRRLEEDQQRAAWSSRLSRSGLSVTGEGVAQVDGALVIGPEAAFTGNGKVGNDSLTSPTRPASVYENATTFAVTTTLAPLLTKTLTVPTGFTSAAVTSTVRVYAINGSAGLDYLYAVSEIGAYANLGLPLKTPVGDSGTNVSSFSTVLTGLTDGGTVTLRVLAQTAYGTWPSSSSHQCDLAALVTWYR